MIDEGDGDKDFDELGKQSLENIDSKIVQNGTTGDKRDVVENGRPLLDRVGQEIEANGVERVVQQPQLSQGVSVCWERFLHVRSVRVLLVENDDSTRHVVAALLRKCSYEVVEASNGLQAWKILEDISNRIDLILTEVVMPCCSGIGLLCKIMSHKIWKNVPVIMMSSHDSMGLVFKCLSKGAVDFLVKPIRKNELKNLWQHVWRRCHSSSGSGSESGTQTQKSIRSKSAEKSDNNSGSNDEDYNGSPALNFGDGSDHGSGTQSSWTKQAVEDQVDSPRLLSNLNEVPECPDSTCAQFTFPNATPSESKLLSITATKECDEQKEPPENRELENVLENVLKNLDHQPKFSVQIPSELTSVNQHTAPNIDCSNYGGRTENSMRDFQEKEELTMPGIAINFSKKPESTDNETDESRVFPSTEQCLKRLRGGQDVEKAVHDERNVLRRSESSAFSRYNALTHNKIVDSPSTTPSKTDTEKNSELRFNIQSHSGSNVMNPCSDGVDLISTSDNKFTDTMASKNKTVEHPSIKKYSSPSGFRVTEINRASSSKQVMLEGVTLVEMVVPLMCSTQEHQVHPENCHHISSNHDDLLMKKLSKPIPLCGSSTILGGQLEGNAGNYSVNGSASGSNSGANVDIMNVESDNGAGGKSGNAYASGNGSGSGSGNGSGSDSKVDQNKLSQREAALTKFRQKRKERCFKRKVRYQSRKRLAEQRPHVRGQFIRQAPPENSSKDAES